MEAQLYSLMGKLVMFVGLQTAAVPPFSITVQVNGVMMLDMVPRLHTKKCEFTAGAENYLDSSFISGPSSKLQ